MSVLLAAEPRPIIQFSGLAKHYGKRQIFSEVSVACYAGKSYLLTGQNGAGKSTLLRVMAGLLKPDAGVVTIDGYDSQQPLSWPKQLSRLRSEVMYLHQVPYLFDGSVKENLSYAVTHSLSSAQKKQNIQAALQWSGLEGLANNPAKQLSGGEKQRVALARAWLRNARMLLLDEPTTNLDQASRLKTVELLASLKKSGVSLVIACHEHQEFLGIADSMLRLDKGVLENLTNGNALNGING